jgi:predicted PurR-regulated permease PerM
MGPILEHVTPERHAPALPVVADSIDGRLAKAAHIAIIAIFFILLCVALESARTLLLPIVAAALVSLALGPLSGKVGRWGFPPMLFAFLVVVALLVVINFSIIQASAVLIATIDKAPEMVSSLQDKLRMLIAPFQALRDLQHAVGSNNEAAAGLTVNVPAIAQSIITFLTPTLGELVVFLVALYFLLIGRLEARRTLVFLFQDRGARLRTLRILNNIEHDLTKYVTTVAAINFGVALILVGITFAVGLPRPFVWGACAFAVEFVPYVGATIMLAALSVVGLAVFDSFGHAAIAPLLFIIADTLEVYVVTPNIIGARLTLSPGMVFLSVVFWAWLWGPIGAILATPLLIVGVVTSKHIFPESEAELPG